jgi:hypothetical protein
MAQGDRSLGEIGLVSCNALLSDKARVEDTARSVEPSGHTERHHWILAMTEAVPKSVPMVSVTATGLLVAGATPVADTCNK